MKIGLIVYGNPERMTGGFLYDRMLERYLHRHGDTVEIISLPWMHYGRALFHHSQAFAKRISGSLYPDLLLVDELCHPSLFGVNGRRKRPFGCPVIAVVHHLRACEDHPTWIKPLYEIVENKFLSSVDGFIFNSHNTRNAVAERIGDKRPYVVACPGGDRLAMSLNTDEVAARAMKPGPLRILFVGNLIPRKGLHHLINALANLEAGIWHLTVVGNLKTDMRYVRTIRRQIASLDLSRVISLQGEIADHELIDRLKKSHLLVVPSFFEGFGIVYLEGMGFGLPAVASASGGAKEIVGHGVNGYLVRYGDTKSLSSYLGILAKDRKLLARMSNAARNTYQDHPTWEDTGKTIRDFLYHFI